MTLFRRQAFAVKHGCSPPPGGLARSSEVIKSAASARLGSRSLDKIRTAVKKFIIFLKDKSGTPLSAITGLDAPHTWDQDRRNYHSFLLAHYVCYVNETHRLVSTSVSYAKAVNRYWLQHYDHVLWTGAMFTNLEDLTTGLKNLNLAVSNVREGLSGADIVVLKSTLRSWVKQGKVARKAWAGHTLCLWDERLAESVIANMEFCYEELFRHGDSTCPDGTTFNPALRLTRDDIRYSKPIEGHRQTITLPAPRMKVQNFHSGFAIVGVMDDAAPINWASAVDRMLALDPTPINSAKDASTPLFRDVRNVPLGESGGLPFTGKWMRGVIRELVDECSAYFGNRVSGNFGIHSFRIGKLNDLLSAGASMFEVSTMGRWVSDAVLRYHRMTHEASTALHSKALLGSITRSEALGYVGHAQHRSEVQQAALSEALLAPAPSSRTSRRHAVAAKESSGSTVFSALRQGTLDSWCQQ